MTPPTVPPKRIARADGLTHVWHGAALFNGLSFELPAGVTLVQGDEQTGKTTLLLILAGELMPNTGWVEMQGRRPDGRSGAFAQQVFRTDPLTNALDQTRPTDWFNTLPQRYPGFDVSTLQALTQAFALQPHLEKPMYMLSAGSRRKVWLSAAFASGAPLTLIDQPFSALDGASVRVLIDVLSEFSQHPKRACVIADYEPPQGVPLAHTIAL